MAKIRVHQLAKELDIDSKVVMDIAYRHGIEVKNHMSALETSDEFMLRAYLEEARANRATAVAAAHAAAAAAPPAPVAQEAAAPEREAEPPPPPEAPARRPATREISVRTVAPPTRAAPPAPPAAPPRREVEAPVAPAAAPAAAAATSTLAPAASAATHAAPPAQAPAPAAPAAPVARPAGRTIVARTGVPLAASTPQPPAPEAPGAPAARPLGRSVTATSIAAGDPKLINRETGTVRRTGEILGRRDLPTRPAVGAPGGPTRSTSGAGGSGLIPSRTDGSKRTFIMTGRGRPPGRPGAPGASGPGGIPGRGGPRGGPQGGRGRGGMGSHEPDPNAVRREITIQMPVTVKALSEAIGVKVNVLIQKLFVDHSLPAKINDQLNEDTVQLLGLDFNCDIKILAEADIEASTLTELEANFTDLPEDMVARAPIVTFLGHVDHGKTSLLDAIRSTTVASKEHGGITQHIGASLVTTGNRAVVFLDTPGHRAFTEMRARGAQLTDVVVLVVAADDGVMPQTKEAIAHARAADVPIVVAVNKIDKPGANPTKVRQELTNEGLQPEEWGGKTVFVDVSAVTGQGVPQLLEYLALESDLLELRANPKRPAVAMVVEAEQSRGEGNLARLLVTNGTLKKGDVFVCGVAYGRVRAIKNDKGRFVATAGPATPVEIAGLNALPTSGDRFYVLDDLDKAKALAERRVQALREKELAKQAHVTLEKLFEKLDGDTVKIILKTDVTGSLEVLKKEISDLVHPEIRCEILHAAVGGINETDVALADASDAIIIGFHVSADLGSRRLADEKKVEIRLYQIIYRIIDDLKMAMEGKLRPEEREKITGHVEVRKTWKVTRLGTIAGCFVLDGVIKRSRKVRVSRDGIVVHEGTIDSLKRVKDDAREVAAGYECGLIVAKFDGIEVGDQLEIFEIESIKRTLEG